MFDDLFKFAILEKLYPGSLGCLITALLVLLLLIYCPEFVFFGILLVIVNIVYLLINFSQKQKITHLSDENRAKIISLAEDYISNLIKNEKELSAEDYKQFNNIVQTENNIKIPTNYAGVPYPIREILYTTYENKIKDINK